MDPYLLLKGLIIGFSIAAPVGPIGVLCIRRTLAYGQLTGLLSGLGAATADAMYGCVAGFGLTFISSFLLHQQNWLALVGGIFLCYLGLKTMLAKPAQEAATPGAWGPLGVYLSTLFLTLTNPATILSFAVIFGGLGLGYSQGSYLAAGLLVLGVFAGSALWWLILSSGVSLFRSRINLAQLQWVNWGAGIIITGFGVVIIASLLFH
jgi:threonine/homoserine/homoserine lactone efflux protein